MKKILIIFLMSIFLFKGYTYSSNNTDFTNCQITESHCESVDTFEFVTYWNEFRNAILTHDTIALSIMINDTLEGDCFIPYCQECQIPNLYGKNLLKSYFMTKIDDLFTQPYIELLKDYNIEQDLFREQNEIDGDRYQCSKVIEQKIYSARLYIDKDNEVVYNMGYQIRNLPQNNIEDYIEINLKFIKTLSGFKLQGIECSYISIAPHYDMAH